jgi:hypothetical protein
MSTNNRFMKNIKSNNSSGSPSMATASIVIFVIIALLICIYLYFTIRGYNNFVNNSPMIIRDTIDGNKPMKIDNYVIANPSDGKYGTEFSYSFWIYLKDSNFNASGDDVDCEYDNTNQTNSKVTTQNFKHIFHKGSNDMFIGGTNSKYRNLPLLQSPGVWLYPDDNKLNIRFNTYNNENKDVYETCDIGNIPINKWVHISIILIGSSVDVYVNCNLKKRQKLSGIPKLNDGDLYINQFGGFNGFLSRFRYYNYAIDPFELDLICKMGPSDNTPVDDLRATSGGSNGIGSYLSSDYWFNYGFPQSAGYPNATSK